MAPDPSAVTNTARPWSTPLRPPPRGLFPAVGQGIGGASGVATFSTLLLPGIVANSIIFVGIFTVGMNLILELDADELDDRVLAPSPVSTPALAKIVAGALQSQIGVLIVFPIAAFLPVTGLALPANWPVLLTFMPLCCITYAALGLALGVVFSPLSGPWLFSVVALPLSVPCSTRGTRWTRCQC